MSRFGRRATLATLSLAVVVSSFASGRTSVATGISDPPPYATQAIPVADGPVVADAALGYLDDVDDDDLVPLPKKDVVSYWERRQPVVLRAVGRIV